MFPTWRLVHLLVTERCWRDSAILMMHMHAMLMIGTRRDHLTLQTAPHLEDLAGLAGLGLVVECLAVREGIRPAGAAAYIHVFAQPTRAAKRSLWVPRATTTEKLSHAQHHLALAESLQITHHVTPSGPLSRKRTWHRCRSRGPGTQRPAPRSAHTTAATLRMPPGPLHIRKESKLNLNIRI